MMTHLKGSFRSAIIHHEENVENGCFGTGAISGLASYGRDVPYLAQSSLLSSFSKP